MPENKSAYTRYLILDECLRNPFAKYTVSSLLKKLNEDLEEKGLYHIGRTQFHKDLNYLEYDLGAPIIREQDGKSKRIRYKDSSFSIRNQTLDKGLLMEIRNSLATILQFKGLHNLEELEEILPKLEKEFDLDTRTKQIIAFEENPYLKGLEFLNPLISYIKNETQLIISYQSFKNTEVRFVSIFPKEIQPKVVSFWTGNWF